MGTVGATPLAVRFLLQEFSRTHKSVADEIGLTKDQMSVRMRGIVPFSSVELDAILGHLDVGWATFGKLRDLLLVAGRAIDHRRGPRADSEYGVLQLIVELRRQVDRPEDRVTAAADWPDIESRIVELKTLIDGLQRELYRLKYERE